MLKYFHLLLFVFFSLLFSACGGKVNQKIFIKKEKSSGMQIARLTSNDASDFQAIREAFRNNNPGYDMMYAATVQDIKAKAANRVVFIQEGGGMVYLNTKANDRSKFSVGDIIMLEKGVGLSTDSLFSALVFTVPEAFPEDIPVFVRPDWDENITDTPGGCATETNAYRRILLTWLNKVGPYQFHALNAHRVRIMDSFTHYHPLKGGFDEFYLVQMAMPGAKIITSSKLELIENPGLLKKENLKDLLQSTPLKAGDLVYLPRGIIHRGVGGVLAQVITVPGFVPGSEIGIDHHLKAINEQFQLKGEEELPLNVSASKAPVVK